MSTNVVFGIFLWLDYIHIDSAKELLRRLKKSLLFLFIGNIAPKCFKIFLATCQNHKNLERPKTQFIVSLEFEFKSYDKWMNLIMKWWILYTLWWLISFFPFCILYESNHKIMNSVQNFFRSVWLPSLLFQSESCTVFDHVISFSSRGRTLE